MLKVPLTEDEAQTIVRAALQRAPKDATSEKIRSIAASEDLHRLGAIVLHFDDHRQRPTSEQLTALIALVCTRNMAGNICGFLERLPGFEETSFTPEQLDLMIRVFEYPRSSYKDSHAVQPNVVMFAELVAGSLSRQHHERILKVIIREGESFDAEKYADNHHLAMDEGLHDLVIDLFRRDTYYGPECAARHASHKTLSPRQLAWLIEAVGAKLNKKYLPHDLVTEFMRRARGRLEPLHMTRIINLLTEAEVHPGALIDMARSHRAWLSNAQLQRIRFYASTWGHEVREEDFDVLAFDPDEIIV
jgi:hypothetical protein